MLHPLRRIGRISRSVALGAGLVLTSASVAAAATPIQVPGDAGWVGTGIEVTAGEPLSVRTLGSVHTAPIPQFHVPGVSKSASGPAGQTWGALCGDVEATLPPEVLEQTGPCAMDDAYFGQLLGRVGDVVFAIGDTHTIVAPASGELELAANDLTLTYWDNNGTFVVLVR